MNKILSIDNSAEKRKKQKKSGPVEIKSVLKFFSISLIIFGIFMIGTGSYSMYKEANTQVTITKPTLNVRKLSDEQLVISVTHDKALEKFTYSWKDDENIQNNVQSIKNIEQSIDIPEGTNTLKIYVKDINGQEIEFKNTYTREGNITLDITKEENGNNIVISATGKNELSYLTYRWDEEDEQKVDINNNSIEHTIEAPMGTHTLTVVVVDINNSTETKEKEIKVVKKPKLEVTADGENFHVKMSDEQGLEKVEFIINEDKKYRVMLNGATEHEFSYPLEEGETRLNVTVYNANGVTENKKVKYTK